MGLDMHGEILYVCLMKVIQVIQSTDPFKTGVVEPPREVTYYNGDDLAFAMASATNALAQVGEDTAFYRVLSVRVVIAEPEN